MLHEAQRTIYDQEYYESEPVLGNMWANINPPGGMNRAHQHPNSLWSGVYYVKAPKNSGNLKIVFNLDKILTGPEPTSNTFISLLAKE